jgi:N-acyl-D-amino-acid deacylase
MVRKPMNAFKHASVIPPNSAFVTRPSVSHRAKKWPIVMMITGAAGAATPVFGARAEQYDVVIRNGEVFDGSGSPGLMADVGIMADKIVTVAPHISRHGKTEIDAAGKVVAPGFINMLSHPEQSLLVDGRGLSDLVQGVTLEVTGEYSAGPLSPLMKKLAVQREGDIKYPITWTTLGQYGDALVRKGISPNIALFVGAGTVRTAVLGEGDTQPTPDQLVQMQGLVKQAMEEGALGVTDALIYNPNNFAKTPELKALATTSARCGGIYIAHVRSEGDRLEQGVQETIDIAKASGAPAEIYHFKQLGPSNWGKLDKVVAMVNEARAGGTRITADMYLYTAGATGLDAAMPPWVQAGGLEQWIQRLKDPATRVRVAKDMSEAHPTDWENNIAASGGPDGVLLQGFKNPSLKPLIGKRLSEVAKMWGESPSETAMDLVVKDGSRVDVAYFMMNEDNVRAEVKIPWMTFGSDEEAPAPEGVFLLSNHSPRAYGNFARLLGHYVRENHDLTLADAIHRLTSLPAANLSLKDRGQLAPGYFADVVVFDPKTIIDHATFEQPNQLATGVVDVLVNGEFALRDGQATGAATGRFVRGRAWAGVGRGGCKPTAADWSWSTL